MKGGSIIFVLQRELKGNQGVKEKGKKGLKLSGEEKKRIDESNM